MPKSFIKKQILSFFEKVMEQDPIRLAQDRRFIEQNIDAPRLQNKTSPYFSQDTTPINKGEGSVIITSRFRSGSTLLWNFFRNASGYTSLYEPFNERQWFNPAVRGDGVDATHRGVSDYWQEYNDMAALTPLYDEDWIRYRLLMTEKSWDPKMRQFIETMMQLSPERPVLQFNRLDFRLPWVKAQFPKATLLHLYRNPRDQFCSFLTDKALMNKDDVHHSYIDNFYLGSWSDNLALHYPFLDKANGHHPYRRFYFVWKLSYLFGQAYADLSFSYEDLVQKPVETLNTVFSCLNDSKTDTEALAKIVDNPTIDGWKRYADAAWFEEHEAYCENVLSGFLSANRHPISI